MIFASACSTSGRLPDLWAETPKLLRKTGLNSAALDEPILRAPNSLLEFAMSLLDMLSWRAQRS